MSVPSPKNVSLAEDYINRARVKLEEARRQMQSIQYDTCISASQECIELSVKGIFLMLLGDYQPQHEVRESEFKRMLASTPDGLSHIDFARVWMVNKFWATFYTTKEEQSILFLVASGTYQHVSRQAVDFAITTFMPLVIGLFGGLLLGSLPDDECKRRFLGRAA